MGAVLFLGPLKRDPNLENYPHAGRRPQQAQTPEVGGGEGCGPKLRSVGFRPDRFGARTVNDW